METEKDPIGQAILDFSKTGHTENIIVKADLCEDDILPVEYLFRSAESMPDLELKALELAHGKVLDVGAAAGCHAKILKDRGLEVTAIDTSPGAIKYLNQQGISAIQKNFFDITGQFDTILILMNGVGLAGKLERLPHFLKQVKKNLPPNGQALCDSADITYLYEEEDGSVWVDLNSQYLGEMQFKMIYKDKATDWFDWLYVEFDLLKATAEKLGLSCEMVYEGPTQNYLARIKHQL